MAFLITMKIHLSSINRYSTAHTYDASYIIGGSYADNIIAQYKDDQWKRLTDLNRGRYGHGSISIGSETMIIGGITWDGRE